MAIEIKVKIEEQPDGSVITHTTSLSIGSTKETAYGMVICQAVGIAAKMLSERAGGHQKELHTFRKIIEMKGE